MRREQQGVCHEKGKSNPMIGQKQSWLRAHRMLAGLLGVGLLVPLGLTVGGYPLSETIFGTDKTPQVDSQHHSPVQVETPQPSWHLNIYDGNKAELSVLPTDPNIRRVEVTQADTTAGWHIQLSHKPIIVEGQEWYSLRFRARADDVRSMGAAVIQAHGPWNVLGLYRSVPLMRQWQDYEWEFFATEDDVNAQITFDMGGWNVPVEVADVRLLKLSNRRLRWKLQFREGSEAGLERILKSPLGTRVAIAKSPKNNPEHIQLVQQGVKLQVNERYRIRFHARADQPRDMNLAVTQAQYPWEGLGLNQQVSLTTEWQLFDLDFVAKSTDENARLIFDLGGHNIPVDIDAVLLQRNSEVVLHGEDSSALSLGGAAGTLDAVEQG